MLGDTLASVNWLVHLCNSPKLSNHNPYSTCPSLHDDNFEKNAWTTLNPQESLSETFRGITWEFCNNWAAIDWWLQQSAANYTKWWWQILSGNELRIFLNRLDEGASTLLGKCHLHSKCVGQDFECLLLSIHEISVPVPTERHPQQDLWHSLLQIKSLLLVASNPVPGHHYKFNLSQALTSVSNKETCS